MNINDGGAAFPTLDNAHHSEFLGRDIPHDNSRDGMSLRDYFAAKAMQGFAQNMRTYDESLRQWLAIKSYEVADAMLAESSKVAPQRPQAEQEGK